MHARAHTHTHTQIHTHTHTYTGRKHIFKSHAHRYNEKEQLIERLRELQQHIKKK